MKKPRKGFKFKRGDFVQSSKYPYYIMSTYHNPNASWGLEYCYKVFNLMTRAKYEVPRGRAEKTYKPFTPSPALVALFCDKDMICD